MKHTVKRPLRRAPCFARCLPAVLLLLCAQAPAWSQEPAQHGFTFRGAPRSVTRGFMITEFGLATLMKSRTGNFSASHATWDVGYMRNLGARTALGGTLFLSTDDHFDEAYFIGLKPRFRYWVWDRLHIDASVGMLLTAVGGDALSFDCPTVVGHAGIGYSDWGSIVLQYEEVKYSWSFGYTPETYHEHNWYLGLVTGSYIGAIAGPLALAAIIFVRNAEWD